MSKHYMFQRRQHQWLARTLGQADMAEPEFNVAIWTLAQGLKEKNPSFQEREFYESAQTARKLRLANVRSAAA